MQTHNRHDEETAVTAEHGNDQTRPEDRAGPNDPPVGSEAWARGVLAGADADTELGLAAARDAMAVAAGELDEQEFRDRHEVGYLKEFGLDRRPRLIDGLTRPHTEPAVTGDPPAPTELPQASGATGGCDAGGCGCQRTQADAAAATADDGVRSANAGGGCGCGDDVGGSPPGSAAVSRRTAIGAIGGTAAAALFFAEAFRLGAFASTPPGGGDSSPVPDGPRTGAGPGTVAAGERTDVQMGMVIDLERCDGCMECVAACSAHNGLSQGSLWALVMAYQEPENADPDFLVRLCQHCTRAPCVMVCPTGARHRRLADGLVLTDYDVCIGCRYCEVACPYGANVFQWADPRMNGGDASGGQRDVRGIAVTGEPPRGVMGKCTFCPIRQDDPATRGTATCANACHMDAIHFGDLNDPDSAPNVYLAQRRAEAGGNLPTFRLLEELGTEPNIIYIGKPPSKDAELVDGPFSLEDWGLSDDRKATLEGPEPWFERLTGSTQA